MTLSDGSVKGHRNLMRRGVDKDTGGGFFFLKKPRAMKGERNEGGTWN